MTRIKFCGLTRPEDAAFAESLGATHAGVILSESPRQIAPDSASRVFDAAPSLRHVGVFRRSSVAEILHDARLANADVVQLHGRFTEDEFSRLRESFDGDIWAVIPMEPQQAAIPEDWAHLADSADAIVLDTSVKGVTGGTGVPFDWQASKAFVEAVSARSTIVLAGGLSPANVVEAVRTLSPSVADVSSGVESAPGIKDHRLMQAFADAVRAASIV